MRSPRQQFEAVMLDQTSILVMGGAAATGPTAACEIVSINPFGTRTTASMQVPRASFASVAMPDGSIVVLSGWTGPNYACTPAVERYDPTTGAWTTVGVLQQERFQHVAARLDAYRILVIGGRVGNSNVLRSCEVFDLRSGTSSPAAAYPFGSSIGRVVRLSDGRVIAFGGRAGGPGSTREEMLYVFDDASNAWRVYGAMEQKTYVPSVCLTRADEIVISGGSLSEQNGGTFNAIATVQVATAGGVAERIGDLQEAKILHDMVELPDGRLMAIGGHLPTNVVTSTSDYIDLTKASIDPAPSLNVARSWLRCFVLRSASDPLATHVLAIGGLAQDGATSVVEELVLGCTNGSSSMLERSRLVTIGNAVQTDDTLRLTPAESFTRGAAWSRDKVDMRAPFTTMIGFRITKGDDQGEVEDVPSDPGADGIVLVIQNEGPQALGAHGRGIGYDGITRSIAVEVDTYHNPAINDPNGNHIAIQSRGQGANTAQHGTSATLAFESNVPAVRSDGTMHYLYVEYLQGRMNVYFDTQPSFRRPIVSRNVDLDSLIGLDTDGRAWVGITSGTGRSYEQHDIVLWDINGCVTESPVSVSNEPVNSGRAGTLPTIVAQELRMPEGAEGIHTVEILDVRGAVVWSATTLQPIVALPADELGQGWYAVRVSTDHGMTVQPWVVVR